MARAKKYRVDIQFTTELSYDVEASSAQEAEAKAVAEYTAGEDTHIHSEVLDHEVTQVVKI